MNEVKLQLTHEQIDAMPAGHEMDVLISGLVIALALCRVALKAKIDA